MFSPEWHSRLPTNACFAHDFLEGWLRYFAGPVGSFSWLFALHSWVARIVTAYSLGTDDVLTYRSGFSCTSSVEPSRSYLRTLVVSELRLKQVRVG